MMKTLTLTLAVLATAFASEDITGKVRRRERRERRGCSPTHPQGEGARSQGHGERTLRHTHLSV
jgi:hypothetical protein